MGIILKLDNNKNTDFTWFETAHKLSILQPKVPLEIEPNDLTTLSDVVPVGVGQDFIFSWNSNLKGIISVTITFSSLYWLSGVEVGQSLVGLCSGCYHYPIRLNRQRDTISWRRSGVGGTGLKCGAENHWIWLPPECLRHQSVFDVPLEKKKLQ